MVPKGPQTTPKHVQKNQENVQSQIRVVPGSIPGPTENVFGHVSDFWRTCLGVVWEPFGTIWDRLGTFPSLCVHLLKT